MNDIKKLQQQDPLSIAEKVTGNDYKKDNNTVWLGMAIQMEKSKQLNKLLDASDDTKFSETTEEYLRKVTDFGFKVVLHDTFDAEGWNKDIIKEDFYILWHDEYSILLSFDTFRGNRNVGKLYYNWSPNDMRNNLTSSGGYEGLCWKEDFSEQMEYGIERPKWTSQTDEEYNVLFKTWNDNYKEYRLKNNLRPVWVGDHDCREAVKNNMILMAENGVFLKKWIKAPFLWLLSHGDTKETGYSYNQINAERISRLPQYIQDCITV